MADTIQITGTQETAAMLLSVSERMGKLKPAMEVIGSLLERSMLKTIQVGGRPDKWKPTFRSSWGNYKPLSISGQLKKFTSSATDNSVESGPTKESERYARVQNFGATITPKRVKALPVPLNEDARKAQQKVGSVRNIPGLFMLPSKKGGNTVGILAKTAKGASKAKGVSKGDIIPMFALRKSVTIPARPFALIQDEDTTRAENVIARYIETGQT